jgi:hypothetical protein
MKKIALFSILCVHSFLCFSQLKSHVDERFELTSIAFRLAGAEEYINNEVANYAADIDTYFAPYQEHALIQYIKKIREQDEVAYNAVTTLTFQLEIKNGQVHLHPQINKTAFLQSEPRWKKQSLTQFVNLLNQFYKTTKFHLFYNQHQNLYKETEKRFDELLQTIHTEWFQSFFGKPIGNPYLYLSLCNGRSNYALTGHNKNTSSDYGIIIGCSQVDQEGIPYFITGYNRANEPVYDKIPLIIHELSHHFSNPLVDKYKQEMMEGAEKMFPYVQERLARAAYGHAKSILYEGLDELFVNMYFQEYKDLDRCEISGNENRGFVWMRRAIRFMNHFYENRAIFPYIENFMPQLASFINTSGHQIEQMMDEYAHSQPYVVNVFPGLNTTVSSDMKEIRVDFSHPMRNIYGIYTAKQSDVVRPKIERASSYWSDDMRTFIIPVTLEKGQNYGLSLPKYIFQSSDCFYLPEDFEILFKTEE